MCSHNEGSRPNRSFSTRMDWSYNTIWFDQLADGDVRSVDFGKRGTTAATLSGGRYLLVRSFKSDTGDFADFPPASAAEYLELSLANVRSFRGLSNLSNMRRLELHHCLKLESDAGLSEASGSLRWLHINQSKKLHLGDELLSLSKLGVLCLNSCAPLPDLEFLQLFPQLLDFRFVNTNVLSGDLTPLLRHPTLCSVGFLNKRHYNLKFEEIERKLADRRKASIEVARKGTYKTFRYRAIDA